MLEQSSSTGGSTRIIDRVVASHKSADVSTAQAIAACELGHQTPRAHRHPSTTMRDPTTLRAEPGRKCAVLGCPCPFPAARVDSIQDRPAHACIGKGIGSRQHQRAESKNLSSTCACSGPPDPVALRCSPELRGSRVEIPCSSALFVTRRSERHSAHEHGHA